MKTSLQKDGKKRNKKENKIKNVNDYLTHKILLDIIFSCCYALLLAACA